MKTLANQIFKIATLFLLVFFINCQKEDDLTKVEHKAENQANTKKVSANDIPDVISFIQSKSNDRMEFSFDDDSSPTFSSTSDPHENDIVITQAMADDIVQVINDGKSNYAFKTTERNPSYFLNLIVVETPDDFYMYFAKYVPSLETYWDGKSLDDFEGTMYVYSDTGKHRQTSYFSNGVRAIVPCECAIGGGGGDDENCHDEAWYRCGFRGSLHQNQFECGCWTSIYEECSGFTIEIVQVCNQNNFTSVESSEINNTTSEECYCWVDETPTGGGGGGSGGGGNNNSCPNAEPCEGLEQYNENCVCELHINPITPINPTPNYGKDINTCLGGNFTLNEINTLNENPTVYELYNYLFDDNGNCIDDNKDFAEYAAEILLIDPEANPFLGADCRSFEFAQPPGALQKGCAVKDFNHTFYALGINSDGFPYYGDIESNVALIYFTMPNWMTNGQAANLTAKAVTNAIKATDIYFFENAYDSEYEVIDFFRDAIIAQLALVGGSMSTTTEPFPIPSPAPYVTSLFGISSPYDCD